MFMININAGGKPHTNTENLQEPFLHNIQVCLHIETVNDLALTELPAPEGRQNPEPPPTCPFICSNNEKDPADANFPLFLKKGIVGADNAVNRVPPCGEAPLTRGYLWGEAALVNRVLQICFRSLANPRKTGTFNVSPR